MTNLNRDLLFVGGQFLLFLAYIPEFKVLFFSPPASVGYAGLGIALTGLCTCVLALLQLRSSLSPFPTPVPHGSLVTNGVYALFRHPVYTGILFAAFGWAVWSGSGYKLIVSLALLLLFNFKAAYEERLLEDKYSDYSAYKQRVGRFGPK